MESANQTGGRSGDHLARTSIALLRHQNLRPAQTAPITAAQNNQVSTVGHQQAKPSHAIDHLWPSLRRFNSREASLTGRGAPTALVHFPSLLRELSLEEVRCALEDREPVLVT